MHFFTDFLESTLFFFIESNFPFLMSAKTKIPIYQFQALKFLISLFVEENRRKINNRKSFKHLIEWVFFCRIIKKKK